MHSRLQSTCKELMEVRFVLVKHLCALERWTTEDACP